MILSENASIEDSTRGLFGDEMTIQYKDSFMEMIYVNNHAFAYNDLNLQVEKNGSYQKFRDEMTSKEMIAHWRTVRN